VPKPELSEEEKTALHNVTSALCNRKQVKDVIEEAIMGTCIALRVPMPEKKSRGKGKEKEDKNTKKSARAGRVEEADDGDAADDESEDAEEPEFEGPPLLKRKPDKAEGEEDVESNAGSESSVESPEFGGFSDSEAEENMFSKYDEFVGGSSDDDESDEDDNDSDLADSRSRSIRKLATDDISMSSEASDDDEESEGSEDSEEDETLAPPSKKAKIKAVKPASFTTGKSAFLPTLMGGYISGSESASDVDVAPPTRKNRRGQRARQAIWDKKYGEKAKHHQNQDSRKEGWDMKRGAVGADEETAKPWKKGIRNPFEKNQVHPDRQRHLQDDGDRDDRDRGKGKGSRDHQPRQQQRNESYQAEKPTSKPAPRRDDEGSLHPSWIAAKKAKEGVQKVEFQGKKVVFD
jgi:hypothetical protein